MRTAAQEELGLAWDAVADWATYVLMREGLESVALIPLARFTRASEWIVRQESRSDSARRRQLAAMLAGRLEDADTDLLSELFLGEARRVREAPHEDEEAARAEVIDAAGVVSHVIDAAALWTRVPRQRAAALEVLRHIIEASLAGEGWTNLERAAMVLAAHGEAEDRGLLARLQRVLEANQDERGAGLIGRLLEGDLSMVEEDQAALAYGERAAAEFEVGGEARDVLAWLLEAAEGFERAESSG